MIKLPLGIGLSLAIAGSCFGADLPSYKAPAPTPPLAFTWTGFYGGVNIGYGFGAGGAETGALLDPFIGDPPSAAFWSFGQNLNGVLGGGQIGFNWQVSPWLVLGGEADIQGTDLHAQRNVPVKGLFLGDFSSINSVNAVDWFGSIRGRAGLVLPSWPNVLVYGAGGFAYGGVNNAVSVANSPLPPGGVQFGRSLLNEVRTGWTAGGGVEWSPLSFPSWSLKVEYLYTDLGSATQNLASFTPSLADTVFVASHVSPVRWQTVRAGVNWRFNPFSVGPVLAKY
ncbi:outer membrane beta-barrel protein [Methylocystis sp. B8]|uniref:outer membrane protein n=1 Tax=Methylocystis sp. B8 TaxID=544938 RepID=UPI0010FDB617|nr:outer membrane beta-barrel protein [Methylocystis sp. B8]TLG76898.1 porin family protein [Methylocystis sp. B8]